MDAPKIVLASNRGPVSFTQTPDGFTTKRGAGGLAGALDPVARRLGDRAVWIAAATTETDRAAVHEGLGAELRETLGYPVRLLDIDPAAYSRYYDDISNRLLWFTNHELWDELGLDVADPALVEIWEADYEPVNRTFAAAVAEAAGEGAIVLLQDYHLATAPAHLRALGGDHTIFHFTHSSFSGPHGLFRLPEPIPTRVVHGMLGADLVGFHVAQWAHGFMDCCEHLGLQVDRTAWSVSWDGREIWVRTYPIPIDVTELAHRAAGEAASRWAEHFRSLGAGRLLVRADRAEPSKNIVRGFDAFSRLLDRRPDLRDEVIFVACVYPSRQSMHEYRDYVARINEKAAELDARHPGAVRLYLDDDFDRTLGALRSYDALLVNPLMDGMNLVSKEGPALNNRSGALILSRRAGSFEEIGEFASVIDDPYDIDATARAIEIALDMDEVERRERSSALRNAIAGTSPSDWIEAQLADLRAIRAGRRPADPAATR